MSIQENAEKLFAIADAIPAGLADNAHGAAADLEAASQGAYGGMAEIAGQIMETLGASHGATPELTGRAQQLNADAESIATRATQLESDATTLSLGMKQLAEQLAEQIRTVASSFMGQ